MNKSSFLFQTDKKLLKYHNRPSVSPSSGTVLSSSKAKAGWPCPREIIITFHMVYCTQQAGVWKFNNTELCALNTITALWTEKYTIQAAY